MHSRFDFYFNQYTIAFIKAAPLLFFLSPQAAELLLRNQSLPTMRTAAKRKIFSPTTGELVDEGLVLLFPGIVL